MSLKGKTILVTGGAGFIGSNLVLRLVADGAKVTVLDSMLPDYGGNLFNLEPVASQINLNFSDMRDAHSLAYLVRDVDYIFNLAGQVSHQDSMNEPLVDMEINVKAQLSLLETCRKHNREAVIVYTSTRQFYGKPQYLPVDEAHPLSPPDVNGINKLAAEFYHLLYARVYGLKTVSLRLTNTYGPRQLIKNSRQGFVGWFVNRAVTGQPIELFGGGGQLRDFNYVDDVVDALIIGAQQPSCYGKRFNLSGEKASLLCVAEKLVKLTGKGQVIPIPFPEERKKIDIGDFYGCSEKYRKASGWQPKTSLDEGLAQTVRYYNEYKNFYLDDQL
jgi:nucleoside-diphosphate-sugar epimerase